jgi:hypothetical protein
MLRRHVSHQLNERSLAARAHPVLHPLAKVSQASLALAPLDCVVLGLLQRCPSELFSSLRCPACVVELPPKPGRLCLATEDPLMPIGAVERFAIAQARFSHRRGHGEGHPALASHLRLKPDELVQRKHRCAHGRRPFLWVEPKLPCAGRHRVAPARAQWRSFFRLLGLHTHRPIKSSSALGLQVGLHSFFVTVEREAKYLILLGAARRIRTSDIQFRRAILACLSMSC